MTSKQENITVEFTYEELRALHNHFYGTDFSDIDPVFQAAVNKLTTPLGHRLVLGKETSK